VPNLVGKLRMMLGKPGVTRPVTPMVRRDGKAPGQADVSEAGGNEESPERFPPARVGSAVGAEGASGSAGRATVAVGKFVGVGTGAPRLQANVESARNEIQIAAQTCFMASDSQRRLFTLREAPGSSTGLSA